MRFVAYGTHDGRTIGLLDGDQVWRAGSDTALTTALGQGLDSLLAFGATAKSSGSPVSLNSVVLSHPIQPPTIRDFTTFESHLEGMVKGAGAQIAAEFWNAPPFYFSNPYAVGGPFDDVPIPPGCARFDYELEVAAVIGRAGRDLTPTSARDHVVAYTVLNDWSARDVQAAEMRNMLGPAKGKDTVTTLGPWLVTADELEKHRDANGFLDLAMSVSVNGELRGEDRLSNGAWNFDQMIALAARGTWVRPGDVIGSGTCGSGCIAEAWGRNGPDSAPSLQVGDVVSMTVEGIGTITNTVVRGVAPIDLGSPHR